jgi:multidrug efflux pump subunit AcrB
VTVTVAWRGASPEAVESALLSPIEEAVDGVPRLAHLHGLAEDGLATVEVELEPGADPDAAVAAVRDALAEARARLPSDADAPVVQLQRGDVVHLAAWTEDERAVDTIARTPGVRAVHACGVREPAMRVEIDSERTAALGLDLDPILDAARAFDGDDASAMGDLPIRESVRLSDVAQVVLTMERACQPVGGAGLVLDIEVDARADLRAVRDVLRGVATEPEGEVLRGTLALPAGTTTEAAAVVAQRFVERAREAPGVAWIALAVTAREVRVLAVVAPPAKPAEVAAALDRAAQLPGVGALALTGRGLDTTDVIIAGEDLDRILDDAAARTKTLAGVVTCDACERVPRTDLVIDRDRAATLGIRSDAIARALAAISDDGAYLRTLPGGTTLRARAHGESVLLAGTDGLVPLDQLVTVSTTTAPRAIRHEDRRRAVVLHVRRVP